MLTLKNGWSLCTGCKSPSRGFLHGTWELILLIHWIQGRGKPSPQDWALNPDYWSRHLISRSSSSPTRSRSPGSGTVGMSQKGSAHEAGSWPKQRPGSQTLRGLWGGEVHMVDTGLGLPRGNSASPQSKWPRRRACGQVATAHSD